MGRLIRPNLPGELYENKYKISIDFYLWIVYNIDTLKKGEIKNV